MKIVVGRIGVHIRMAKAFVNIVRFDNLSMKQILWTPVTHVITLQEEEENCTVSTPKSTAMA